MSTNEQPNRQPQGIPVGGQFAATSHAEPEVALAKPVTPFHDADGTDWEFGGDEYTDVYTSHVGGIEARVTTDLREEGARATVVDFRGNRPLEVGEQAHFESLDDAKAHAKEIRERAHRYEHNTISAGGRSPWGNIQETKVLAPGIDAVYTAGHGGLRVSSARNEDIDPGWREGAFYEEDCAWSKAAITHHQDLPTDYVKAAHETARRWYPDEYEAVVGKDPAKYGVADYTPVTAAESHVIETREFLASRADTHVKVNSVARDLDGHAGMVAVTVSDIPADGRMEDDAPVTNYRTILVPEEEFKLPYTEKLTFPKTDKYQVLTAASV